MKIILGITGASGAIYARHIIEHLNKNREKFTELAIIFTDAGQKVWNFEITDLKISEIPFNVFDNNNLFAPMASGTAGYDTMIVCPCSMGTMAKIANGIADNLLTRSADVMLKENKNLIIVPRETPLNAIHINNMYKLTQSGAKICPAMPSFYSKPQSIDSLVDTVIQKIFALAKIDIKFFDWK